MKSLSDICNVTARFVLISSCSMSPRQVSLDSVLMSDAGKSGILRLPRAEDMEIIGANIISDDVFILERVS